MAWYKILLVAAAVWVVYRTCYEFLGRMAAYKASLRFGLRSHQRVMTRFICEALLGKVPQENLDRLARATGLSWLKDAQNIERMPDDFDLIARAYFFWNAGFQWQDWTTCVNCGCTRLAHNKDGGCPEGGWWREGAARGFN